VFYSNIESRLTEWWSLRSPQTCPFSLFFSPPPVQNPLKMPWTIGLLYASFNNVQQSFYLFPVAQKSDLASEKASDSEIFCQASEKNQLTPRSIVQCLSTRWPKNYNGMCLRYLCKQRINSVKHKIVQIHSETVLSASYLLQNDSQTGMLKGHKPQGRRQQGHYIQGRGQSNLTIAM